MNFIITLIILLFILGLIISVHEFGHFIAAKKSGVYVEEFSIGMGPLIFKHKPKKSETTYSLRLLPIGGFVAMSEREEDDKKIKKDRVLENKGFLKQFWVFINGIVFNFLLAMVIFFISGLIFGRPIENSIVAGVPQDYPAYQSGIEVGDEIIKVNGVNIDTYYDFSVEVNAKKSKNEYTLTVKKIDGSIKEVVIKPIVEKINNEEVKRFGVSFKTQYKKGLGQALIYSIEGVVDTTVKIWDTLVMLFTRQISTKNLSGPVGMYSIIDSARSNGFINILYITAYLSINVGIINLFPIPVFDGGRILILCIEKILKRKTSKDLEIGLNLVGFGLMILLMIFVTFNDIARLFGG